MNWSFSTKVPGSQSSLIRSLAVSFPFPCCAVIRFSPPPSIARLLVSSMFRFTFSVRFAPSSGPSSAAFAEDIEAVAEVVAALFQRTPLSSGVRI